MHTNSAESKNLLSFDSAVSYRAIHNAHHANIARQIIPSYAQAGTVLPLQVTTVVDTAAAHTA